MLLAFPRKVNEKPCYVGTEDCKATFIEVKVGNCKCAVFVSRSCFNIDIGIVRNNTAIYGIVVYRCSTTVNSLCSQGEGEIVETKDQGRERNGRDRGEEPKGCRRVSSRFECGFLFSPYNLKVNGYFYKS